MTEQIKSRISEIKQGKVPDGYKTTINGVIPNEWTEKKLSDLLTFKNGINAEKSKFGSGVKLISVMDILDESPITYEKIQNSINIDDDTLNVYCVTYGDILFQRSSETFIDAGKSNVYLDKSHVATFSGFVIRGKKSYDYNPVYLNSILKLSSIRKQIINLAAGSQHINIGQESLAKIDVFLPALNEQQRIAEVLMKWDEGITLQKELIEKLEVQKKALMQEVFKKHDTWEEVNFADIYSMAGEGGTPTTSNTKYYVNGDIPFVKIEHLFKKYIYEIDSFITELGMKNSGAWLIPANSLLYSNGATIGEISINKIPITTKQGILGIVPNGKVLTEFLYYLMESSDFINKIKAITTKGTMPIAYLKDINNLKIHLPAIEKQTVISESLSKIDQLIDLRRKNINALKLQKKSLMQLLLTGIVRV